MLQPDKDTIKRIKIKPNVFGIKYYLLDSQIGYNYSHFFQNFFNHSQKVFNIFQIQLPDVANPETIGIAQFSLINHLAAPMQAFVETCRWGEQNEATVYSLFFTCPKVQRAGYQKSD